MREMLIKIFQEGAEKELPIEDVNRRIVAVGEARGMAAKKRHAVRPHSNVVIARNMAQHRQDVALAARIVQRKVERGEMTCVEGIRLVRCMQSRRAKDQVPATRFIVRKHRMRRLTNRDAAILVRPFIRAIASRKCMCRNCKKLRQA